jgi:hypothetical protein
MSKAFSIPGSFTIVTVLCAVITTHYHMDGMSTAISITCGWFFIGKLVLAMSFTRGYGVKGTYTVAGMPMLLAAFITCAVITNATLLVSIYQNTTFDPTTMANLLAFGWSIASGLATGVGHWYFYGRQEYFDYSEYDLRLACKARGDSPELTAANIADYRERHGQK